MTLGPAQLEVIRQATLAVAEEMKFDLMRTARSPVLREAGDLSCALTDAAGRTVAQGHDIPMHLACSRSRCGGCSRLSRRSG